MYCSIMDVNSAYEMGNFVEGLKVLHLFLLLSVYYGTLKINESNVLSSMCSIM
jgi:hypothetical protein